MVERAFERPHPRSSTSRFRFTGDSRSRSWTWVAEVPASSYGVSTIAQEPKVRPRCMVCTQRLRRLQDRHPEGLVAGRPSRGSPTRRAAPAATGRSSAGPAGSWGRTARPARGGTSLRASSRAGRTMARPPPARPGGRRHGPWPRPRGGRARHRGEPARRPRVRGRPTRTCSRSCLRDSADPTFLAFP